MVAVAKLWPSSVTPVVAVRLGARSCSTVAAPTAPAGALMRAGCGVAAVSIRIARTVLSGATVAQTWTALPVRALAGSSCEPG